jgi:DMSO/TMAO reductase YedYZ heme-binding membrane subunit
MKSYFKYFIIFLIGAVIALTVGLLFFESDFDILKEFGKFFGFLSVISYILTLLPGIIRRLKLHLKTTVLTLARQQLGILMFVSAFTHYILSGIRTVFLPIVQAGGTPKISTFMFFGFLALVISLPMFLTSNNWIKRKMKLNWIRLHLLTHILGWVIFGHIVLRNFYSPLNLLLLIVILADIWSFLRPVLQSKES